MSSTYRLIPYLCCRRDLRNPPIHPLPLTPTSCLSIHDVKRCTSAQMCLDVAGAASGKKCIVLALAYMLVFCAYHVHDKCAIKSYGLEENIILPILICEIIFCNIYHVSVISGAIFFSLALNDNNFSPVGLFASACIRLMHYA